MMKKLFDRIFRSADRIIAGTAGRQLLFFLMIAVTVFIVLLTISVLSFSSSEEGFTWRFWNMLLNFIDPGAGFDYESNAERLLILITNLAGMVLFAGVLVALLTNTIYQRIDNVKNGEVYYHYKNHFVIIGFDPVCSGLAAQLAAANEVVLQTSRDVQAVRQELFSNLDDDLEKRITVVSGNRLSADDVKKLNIESCVQVFLLGETDEDSHDSKNIECLGIINEIAAAAKKNIRCHVLFNHHLTFSAFQQQEIAGIRDNIDFVPFNFYDLWAQKVFVENSYHNGRITYKPLDREPITEDSSMRVHLVILGMSRMGIALGLQAAQICHFPNFTTKGIKTKITFIDVDAEREMAVLKRRLRHFFDEIDYSLVNLDENSRYSNETEKTKFTDIEFEFIKDHFEDDPVQHYLEEAAMDKSSYLTVAVALPDSSDALSAALCLPSVVYDSGASVLVRQEHSYAIVSMISREPDNAIYCKYKNMRPFGMVHNAYDIKQADDILPMMIKYVYDNTTDEKIIREFPKDEVMRNWIENWRKTDNLSALKASNRYAANFIPVKQRSLGIKEGVDLNERQIYLAARIEHNRWVTEKLLVGFRAPTPEEAAGITKEKREYYKSRFVHEDIKAYQELGEDGKAVDVRIYDVNISHSLPYMIRGER
jgi:hypothetical protein